MTKENNNSGEINISLGLEELAVLLSSDNQRTRKEAVKAIGELKTKKAFPYLFNALNAEKFTAVRARIAHQIRIMGNPGPEAIDSLLEFIKTRSSRFRDADTLRIIGDIVVSSRKNDTVTNIITMVKGRCRNQKLLLDMLAKIGDPAALDLLYARGYTRFYYFTDEESLSFHIKMLSSLDKDIRMQAIRGLSNFRSQKALGGLLTAAQDPQYQVKNLAIRVLGDYREPEATDLLLSILENDSRKTTRAKAALALTAHNTPTAVAGVQEALQNELNQSGNKDPNNSYLLQELVKANNPVTLEYLQKQGLIYSKETSGEDDLAAHIQMLASPVQETRELAIKKIAKSQTKGAADALMQAVDDENFRIRIAAVEALKHHKNPEVTEFLLRLIKNDPQTSVRAAAVASISQHGVLDIIPEIAKTYQNEKKSVRQESANALGHYGGERTVSRTARGVYNKNHREYKPALVCFNQALEADSGNFLALYYRGLTNSMLKNHEEALKDLNKYLEICPHDPYGEGYYHRGIFKYLLDDHHESLIADLNKSIELHPEMDQQYIVLGDIYLENDQIDKAINSFSQYIELRPDDWSGYSWRATCYITAGKYFKAIEDLTKKIEISPMASTYFSRSSCFYKLGFVEDALNDLDKALEMDLDDITKIVDKHYGKNSVHRYRATRAQILIEWGEYHEAIADCNVLIDHDLSVNEGLRIRSFCYLQMDNLNKAQEDISRLLIMEPKDAWGLFNQACIDALQGNQESALTNIRAVLEQDSEIFCGEIKSTPALDRIRENPEFIDIVKAFCD